MPNPHYQRVLQQDQALPALLRWLSRVMSSWWTIFSLALLVVGYVFFAHVRIGDQYAWQWRAFDTTQHAMLTWWPLLIAAWLLAIVLLWSAMRRLPWRADNLGAFIAVIGLAIILVSQSWAFRSQTVGIAAVPISEATGNTQADALALNYTTRYGDTHDRVLVVMVGGAAPITIPLDDIPRWNDAAGEAMPKLKLHDHPKLASAIGYGTRITTSAYIADGTLTETEDGTQAATRNEGLDRSPNTLPYPANALLALEITADLEDGGTQTTTAWLPFEPEGTDSLVPKQFFPVDGLGSVGLAFRPASKKLPFALGANMSPPPEKLFKATVHVMDADRDGRLLQPAMIELNGARSFKYDARDVEGVMRQFRCEWLRGYMDWGIDQSGNWAVRPGEDNTALIAVSTNTSNPFILAGMISFVLGVIIDRALILLGSLQKYGDEPPAESPVKGQSPNPAPRP